MNKKLIVGLTVLATPFVVENIVEENIASANQTPTATTQAVKSNEYVLNKPAKAYMTANDAAKRVNQKATYQAGTYQVYNQSKGMVNISKATGKPGSWINPVDNPNTKKTTVVPQQNRPIQTGQVGKTITTSATGNYTLAKATPAYVTAVDASKKVNARGTVSAGNYHIFREYNGMLNVSREQGKVGSWINPGVATSTQVAPQNTVKTTPVVSAQTVATKTETGLYALANSTPAYVTAVDASKKVNARGTVSAGNYHLFREYNGMLNLSKSKGRAGSWINPGVATSTQVAPQNTAKSTPIAPEQPVVKSSAGLYTLTRATQAYITAVDASKEVNARGRVLAGNYHIYREYKGMLNLSKVKGRAGAWINPGVEKPAPVTPVKANPQPASQPQVAGTKTATGTYALRGVTEKYVNAADANNKVNARGKLTAGEYYIFREYKGMINLSTAKGKPGSWINPGMVVTQVVESSTPTVITKPEEKPVTPAPVVKAEEKPVTPAPVVKVEEKPVTPAPVVKAEEKPVTPAPVVKPEEKPVTPAPVVKTEVKPTSTEKTTTKAPAIKKPIIVTGNPSYDRAVYLTANAEFAMSKVDLDKIKTPVNAEVNIELDKKINIDLLGIFMNLRQGGVPVSDRADLLNELSVNFDEKYKNQNSRMLEVSAAFRGDVKKLVEYLRIYAEAENYSERKEKEKLSEVVAKLDNFEFETDKLKEVRDWGYSTSKFKQ